jgi:endoglycosylceramidase
LLHSAISVKDRMFVDQDGRQVILHGISLVDKDPQTCYLAFRDPSLFRTFREWGFNCVRLGVIWAGLEPEPGRIDEGYLQGLDEQIAFARENELCVFLDMHQDLYSVLYADGAPGWATMTHGQPHITRSDVWSDAYFTSPAVQAALDSFWRNAPAPDGIGLQDHYAAAWSVLAERYAGNPAVVGYDLMNEPFPGSVALQAQQAMFAKGAEILAETGVMSGMMGVQPAAADANTDPLGVLMQFWLTPQGRSAILEVLRDVDIYAPVIDAQEPFYSEFERTGLMDFYTRVARQIRRHDRDGLLLLETTMASNMGVYSAIEPVTDSTGARDPYQVYAPHGYDLVTDTPDLAGASPERVELIFTRHAETARRLDMPMLVGEWGAFGDRPGTLGPARQVVSLFERLQCSETFWAYFPGIADTPSFPAVQRPYPERVAGRLVSYRYDPSTDVFTCEWQEEATATAPTRVYLPGWFGPGRKRVVLEPVGDGFRLDSVSPSSSSVWVEVPPRLQGGSRRLTISLRDVASRSMSQAMNARDTRS